MSGVDPIRRPATHSSRAQTERVGIFVLVPALSLHVGRTRIGGGSQRNLAKEILDVIREWFSPQGTSTDEAMARIIVALERRGVLFFGQQGQHPRVHSADGGKVVSFPCRRRVGRERR